MKTFYLLSLLTCLTFSEIYHAQKIDNWEKSPRDKVVSRKFSNNFFLSGGISPFLSFYKYQINGFRTDDFELINFEVGLRYNVFNFHDFFSVSVSSYPNLGFNANSRISGMISSFPIGLDINLFNNSTYNNINKIGCSVGAGRSFNFGTNGYAVQTNYLRGVIRYNKYARKFSKKHKEKSKLINGYFGAEYSFTNSSFTLGNDDHVTSMTNFKILIGRTFGL